MKKTKVEFYYEKDFKDVFVFFPLERMDSYGHFMSYAHIGQHSACHVDYVKECKKAIKKDYLPLYNELIQIGYQL